MSKKGVKKTKRKPKLKFKNTIHKIERNQSGIHKSHFKTYGFKINCVICFGAQKPNRMTNTYHKRWPVHSHIDTMIV